MQYCVVMVSLYKQNFGFNRTENFADKPKVPKIFNKSQILDFTKLKAFPDNSNVSKSFEKQQYFGPHRSESICRQIKYCLTLH